MSWYGCPARPGAAQLLGDGTAVDGVAMGVVGVGVGCFSADSWRCHFLLVPINQSVSPPPLPSGVSVACCR